MSNRGRKGPLPGMVFSELSCEELARHTKEVLTRRTATCAKALQQRESRSHGNVGRGNAVRRRLETVVRLAAGEVSKPRGWGDIFP